VNGCSACLAASGYREHLGPYASLEAARLRALAASPHGGLDLAELAAVPKTTSNTVNTGPVTNNITVNVGGSNANPQAIGEAAGNAAGSAMRGLLGHLTACHRAHVPQEIQLALVQHYDDHRTITAGDTQQIAHATRADLLILQNLGQTGRRSTSARH
jgi:hypothetical protein